MNANLIEKVKNKDVIINDMYKQISDIITTNKNKMIYQINNTLVENEQNENCQPVAGNLSWSHYCFLIYIY